MIISFNEKAESSHLRKLENALFALVTFIQQRHLLHNKKESITARKVNEYVTSVKENGKFVCNKLDIKIIRLLCFINYIKMALSYMTLRVEIEITSPEYIRKCVSF